MHNWEEITIIHEILVLEQIKIKKEYETFLHDGSASH